MSRKFQLSVHSSVSALAAHAIRILLARASAAIMKNGIFTIAVSGGSMPKLFSGLAHEENVDWNSWRFLFADERCVALDSVDSNYLAWNEEVFSKLNIPRENIITINSPENPLIASEDYELQLKSICPDLSLDLVLLGMGPDGHTASLFPGHGLLRYSGENHIVPITDSPKPPPSRITMTLSAINKCKEVIKMNFFLMISN